MVDKNSLETYVSLTVQLYHDIAQCYPCTRESHLDLKKLRSRVDFEGISFLTKSLPKLGKAIDTALHSDLPLLITGFVLRRGSAIPRFLGWLIEKVFTSEGYVRSDPDITALRHLRQFLYFTYKLKLPYDKTTESSVVESFVRTQQELHSLEFPECVSPILREARSFITRLFGGLAVRDIIPRHGPGAVSTGEEIGEKSNFSRIYRHTEMMYPFTEYFMLGLNQVVDQLDWIDSLESLPHGTASVVLVPKDSRGPRLISKEPLELQWIQQGIQKLLYSWIERHPMTRGFVNFTSQSINRTLALESSRTYQYVTLDMKDASDRVTLKLVEKLFSGTSLFDALIASRSEYTRLPDGKEVHLSTFAPMGSAVCFPIEAICFYALAVSVLHLHLHKGLKHPVVFVYGDDIIVEREAYPLLLQYFPQVGLKFNLEKCCVGGSFRESCGCDAFLGVDVTPIRLRTTWSSSMIRDASELISYVELSNSLWEAGYWRTATSIQQMVEARYGLLPFVRAKFSYRDLAGRICVNSSSLIGWYRPHVSESIANRGRLKVRLNPKLHRIEYRNWIIRPVKKLYDTDGWRECLRVLNTAVHNYEPDLIKRSSTHSDTSVYALPHRVCLRRGWAAA
jgi:hypothetical protein